MILAQINRQWRTTFVSLSTMTHTDFVKQRCNVCKTRYNNVFCDVPNPNRAITMTISLDDTIAHITMPSINTAVDHVRRVSQDSTAGWRSWFTGSSKTSTTNGKSKTHSPNPRLPGGSAFKSKPKKRPAGHAHRAHMRGGPSTSSKALASQHTALHASSPKAPFPDDNIFDVSGNDGATPRTSVTWSDAELQQRQLYLAEMDKTTSLYRRFEIAMHRDKGGTIDEAREALLLLISNPNRADEHTADANFIHQTSKDSSPTSRSPNFFSIEELCEKSNGEYDSRLIMAMLKLWPGIDFGGDGDTSGQPLFDDDGCAMTKTTRLPNACRNNAPFKDQINTFRLRRNVRGDRHYIQVVMEHSGKRVWVYTVAWTNSPYEEGTWDFTVSGWLGEAVWTCIGLILERHYPVR